MSLLIKNVDVLYVRDDCHCVVGFVVFFFQPSFRLIVYRGMVAFEAMRFATFFVFFVRMFNNGFEIFHLVVMKIWKK